MSNNTPAPKERTTKWLAVVGFLALLLAMAWFIFTTIAFVPNLVATVGSLFTDDSEPSPVELILTPETTTAAHAQPITLEWEPAPTIGSYAIWFACAEGVRIQVATPEDGTQEINCSTFYNIGDLTAVRTTFLSETQEEVSVEYQVAFLPETDPDAQFATTGQLTIQNQALALADDTDEADTDEPVTETPVEDEPAASDDDTTSEPDVTPTVPQTPQYREEVVYQVPQSDPNGTTDLAVAYRGVGTISNGSFVADSSFDSGDRGAIRFTVTNQGTRTSETWRYTAELPNGQTYRSPSQAALRPNETATISLGFRAPAERGSYPFRVNTETSRDQNRNNHSFSWSVAVR